MIVAGIDVGKANLDVSVSEGPVNRFDNTVEGISKLLKHLAEQDANMAVCESTGGYERLVVDRLRKTGIHLHVAQPTRVRAFARACGYQAKTDQRDAQVLSRFGSVFQEHDAGITMPEPELEELRDLLRRHRQLVEQRVQELGRVDKVVSLAVAESTNRHIAWLEAEIEQLDRKYQEKVQNSPPLSWQAALYRTVPGVGVLTAAILVAHLPELGLVDAKALASLVGVAPWSRDSGQKRGQRAIRGGRSVVRRALHICAWSVIRTGGALRHYYQGLRQRGKPGKVALVAVMRKLLLQLNAVARRGTPWVPETA